MDWPYVQPGVVDGGWAPGTPQTFEIFFGLETAPAEPCRLELDFADTHSSNPPKLRVEVNELAREYHWDLHSVHWEPDEPVTAAQWAAFDTLRAQHPGNLMLWENEPLAEVRAELQKRAVRPLVFLTCGNRPPSGDYLQAMNRNLEAFRAALK